MTYLTRAADAQATWPFGAMDALQAQRHEQARRILAARIEQERRQQAEQALRDLLARLPEASL